MLYCIIFSGAHIYRRLLKKGKQTRSLRKKEFVCLAYLRCANHAARVTGRPAGMEILITGLGRGQDSHL